MSISYQQMESSAVNIAYPEAEKGEYEKRAEKARDELDASLSRSWRRSNSLPGSSPGTSPQKQSSVMSVATFMRGGSFDKRRVSDEHHEFHHEHHEHHEVANVADVVDETTEVKHDKWWQKADNAFLNVIPEAALEAQATSVAHGGGSSAFTPQFDVAKVKVPSYMAVSEELGFECTAH